MPRNRLQRHATRPPQFTIRQILDWADQLHERTGRWPVARRSGRIPGSLGENWHKVDTALRLGLLTSVVPDADLQTAASEFAARLAAGPTLAYAAIKEALLYGASHRLSEALEKEADLQVRLGQSEDHRNATQAFVAKQTPTFQGR